MKVVFSSEFKTDLLAAETRYEDLSDKLGGEFHERVKETVRSIIARGGGDHIGPHGFPCRVCRPFPFLLYYAVEGGTLFILGLIHERRHPVFLMDRIPPPD